MVAHRMPITTAPYDHDENVHRFCMELLLHAVREFVLRRRPAYNMTEHPETRDVPKK